MISKLKEIFNQLEASLKEGAGGAKQVLREGMIRRIIIQNESGREIFSAPVNVGVGVGLVGLIAAPLIAAAAGVVLVVRKCRPSANAGDGLSQAELDRLEAIKVELDRVYDLLHQRQARASAGMNPDEAIERSAEVVERYQQ